MIHYQDNPIIMDYIFDAIGNHHHCLDNRETELQLVQLFISVRHREKEKGIAAPL